MKILQVCSYLYPALSYGGPAKLVFDLSEGLSKKNEVTVYTTDVWDQKRRIKSSEKLNNSKDFRVYYFQNIYNSIAFKYRIFTGFGMVTKFLNDFNKYDIIHIHDVYIIPQMLIALLCIFFKKPYFITPHGILDPVRLQKKSLIKKIFTPIVSVILKKANSIIAVSKQEKLNLHEIGNKNIVTIYNGISNKKIIPSKKFRYLKNNKIVTFLYIGKLHSQKGIIEMISAAQNLDQRKFQIIIAGPDDGIKTQIEEIITNNNIKNIHLLGFVNDQEKKELTNLSDIFIHPSYAEGFSISILEAMLESLPVIITDGCNFEDVGINKAGIIINKNNIKNELKKHMKLIIEHKVNYHLWGINARNLIIKKYLTNQMVKSHEKLYEKYI